MDVCIRKVDPVAIKKIDELAKRKGISRNEYLKKHIEQMAITIIKDISETEDKYANLVETVVDRLEQANDIIQENSIMLKRVIEQKN